MEKAPFETDFERIHSELGVYQRPLSMLTFSEDQSTLKMKRDVLAAWWQITFFICCPGMDFMDLPFDRCL
jgi:hypothetical protein